MGLFDFVKDVGDRIFETDDEAADKIKESLEVRTSGIRNLDVDFDDGCATLHGECINQATKDMAVLMAGNMKGVEKVVADDLTVEAPKEEKKEEKPEPEPRYEFYTIVKGDTLSKLAQKYYGKAGEYMRIFEANSGLISNPDKIYPGQKIRIPLD